MSGKMVSVWIIFTCFISSHLVLSSDLLSHTIDKLEEEVTLLENERNVLKSHLSSLDQRLGLNPRPYNLDKSAFSVTMLNEYEVSDDTTIVFDTVITDNTDDYNQMFGFYTCPFDGFYLFTLSIASPAEPAGVRLTRGQTETLMEMTTYNVDATRSGAHTNSITVSCAAGSDISVKSLTQGGATSVTLTGGNTTIFSGYLISQ